MWPRRIGGEEFAVWLPDTDLELGARIAERIRLKLGDMPWDWQGRVLAAQRIIRRGRLSRDQQQPRQPAGPSRLGAVPGQAQRTEPGGTGGAVGAGGRRSGGRSGGRGLNLDLAEHAKVLIRNS